MPTIYRILDATTGEHLVSVVGPRDATEAMCLLDWTAVAAQADMGGRLDVWRKAFTFEVGEFALARLGAIDTKELGGAVWSAIRRYFVDKEAA